MKGLLLAMLIVTALASHTPIASAHQCASGTSSADCACPIPNDGKYHQHSSPAGSCQGGPGGSQNADANGASQSIPGTGGAAVVLAAIGVALASRR